MNPFLVIATCLDWGVCIISLLLIYLSKEPRSSHDSDKLGFATIVCVITAIIGIFLFIGCGASWNQLYGQH